MATVSVAVRRYLILLRNAGSMIGDLPSSAWMLFEANASESVARARYFAMRAFLEERGAPCLVVESVKPILGPEQLRVIISRAAVLEKGRVPDAVRLSREQSARLGTLIEDAARRGGSSGRLKVRPCHGAALAAALAGCVAVMVGIAGYTLWQHVLADPTAGDYAAEEREPAGSLVVLPDGNSSDRLVMFRLLPDGTRTDERRISRAGYDALRAQGGRALRGGEQSGTSRTPSLAEHASDFARFRAAE